MKAFVVLSVLGMSAGAVAAPAQTGTIIVLKCELRHSVPRDAHHAPPPPFTQHFRVNLEAGTVDGVHATVSDDKIGWEPAQSYLRPYATLSRPNWQFHEVKYYGHARDQITGPCVPQS